jgi:hypothetical protein
MTKDEVQRSPSTLLRAVSLSNGRWTFCEAVKSIYPGILVQVKCPVDPFLISPVSPPDRATAFPTFCFVAWLSREKHVPYFQVFAAIAQTRWRRTPANQE